MVKNMGYIDNFTGKVWDWTKPFQRTGKFPLDRSSMFASYEDALLYAKGDGSDSRGLGATSYIGQTITVWGPNDKGVEGVWVYSLVPTVKEGFAAELKAVGSTQTETAATYSAAVELSKDLVVGQLIKVTNDEEVDASGDSEDSDVTKITYKAGFYIVDAPGYISALDTSTGASDEIGVLKGRIEALESNRVLKTDFEAYQETITSALDAKVDDSDFEAYQETITSALDAKVDDSTLETYKGEVSNALDAKVDDSDFEAYQETITSALDAKVDESNFTEYQTTVSNTLDTKVDDSDFTEYQTTVSNALDAKVDDSDFTEYQTTVSNALDTKATVEALNTLEDKVDIDIANLSKHMTEAAAKIAEVDDRLSALDAFVEAHESILESDIVSLFTPKTE